MFVFNIYSLTKIVIILLIIKQYHSFVKILSHDKFRTFYSYQRANYAD